MDPGIDFRRGEEKARHDLSLLASHDSGMAILGADFVNTIVSIS
jgi:hypothetical protein